MLTFCFTMTWELANKTFVPLKANALTDFAPANLSIDVILYLIRKLHEKL